MSFFPKLGDFTHSFSWVADVSIPMAIGASVPAIIGTFRNWLQAESARRLTAETDFSNALNSDDLGKISSYLQDEFRKVTLGSHLRDGKIRTRLDKYLTRLSELV